MFDTLNRRLQPAGSATPAQGVRLETHVRWAVCLAFVLASAAVWWP